MAKAEKEEYKEARVPRISDLFGGKRKREASELNTENKLDPNISSSSNKLAKFAAPQ